MSKSIPRIPKSVPNFTKKMHQSLKKVPFKFSQIFSKQASQNHSNFFPSTPLAFQIRTLQLSQSYFTTNLQNVRQILPHSLNKFPSKFPWKLSKFPQIPKTISKNIETSPQRSAKRLPKICQKVSKNRHNIRLKWPKRLTPHSPRSC